MITKFPKTPNTNHNYRKPNTNTGKVRAAQIPKGTASAKSSFFLNSQASTSSLAHSSKPRTGFMSSQGEHRVGMDNSAVSSSLKGTKSQQCPGRFASPKVSAPNGWGLSKTTTNPNEAKRANNMSTKEYINHLYSPITNSK